MWTMRSLDVTEAWERLARYRQRYDIDDRLDAVLRLGQSIRRRRERLHSARRRVAELEKMLAEARHAAQVLNTEVTESEKLGAVLIDEILDQVRIEMGEAWSPRPIRGYRMWEALASGFHGATGTKWESPTMVATCLSNVPGEDIPHRADVCGWPACGIYASKRRPDLPHGGSLYSRLAIGVVAMTGKVVEHELGYRAARATVIAIAVRWGDHTVVTDDPEIIAALFADPAAAMDAHAFSHLPDEREVEEFLEKVKREEEAWI